MGFVSDFIGDITGANAAQEGANKAADAQVQAAQLGIDETSRQFDALQALLKPFVNAGTDAIAGYGNLLGTNGYGSQREAINVLQSSPEFRSLVAKGENAILQNASATGGLRGGNVQASLAQFRPEILSQLINQQFQRLGGIAGLGQNAAAGVGNAGMQSGAAISNLLQQQGAARAGQAIAQGNANASNIGGVGQLLGTVGSFFF